MWKRPLQEGTAHEFGHEWSMYPDIIDLHEKQFEGWITPLATSFFKGKSFLDAGCGIGRNSLWALKAGASSGYAFDFDQRTVAVARENLKQYPHCRVAFQSIYDLDISAEFDVAFCIGVIHHLADPKKAMANLVRSVKPGGTLIIWAYAYEGNERYLFFFDYFRRKFFSRLPVGVSLWLARILTAFLKIYLLLPHRSSYLKMLKTHSFRHLESMVFDQIIPSISKYYHRNEVADLIQGLDVRLETLTHTHGMSWTLVARKTG